MTQFLQFGTQITSSADSLRAISTLDIFQLVTEDASLRATTERLRLLRSMDKEAYRTVKTRLPYVVGSEFSNDATGTPIRRMDMYVAAHYFILDLDECPGLNGRVPDAVRQDEAVALAFISPSGQGLKLFFRLADPCTDARQFSTAYRNFATHIGIQYRWTNSIDLRTSDVTRACFLAHDPAAYHNADAFPVDWRLWLTDADGAADLSLFADETELKTGLATLPQADRPINIAAYRDVLKQINPRTPVRRERQVFVPDSLRELEPEVRAICQRLNWELTEVRTLNFGLKFAIKQGFRRAELNVFFGKKGFSLVRSPKTGCDPALTDLLYGQLYGILFPEPITTDVLLTATVLTN